MNLDGCFEQGLLKKVPPDNENARKSLLESERNVGDAEKNFTIGCFNVVVVLGYTTMFHAARGLLFKDGVKKRGHLCIPIYVREKYPSLAKFANVLDSYRILRHRTLYGLEVFIDETEAREALRAARDFLWAAGKIVK